MMVDGARTLSLITARLPYICNFLPRHLSTARTPLEEEFSRSVAAASLAIKVERALARERQQAFSPARSLLLSLSTDLLLY